MRYLVSAMLVVVAVIHLLPLSGVLGSERLAALYGLSFNEPNLAILMRHRAVLFGLLGLFLLFAAFRPPFQTIAFMAGFVSVVSFLWLLGLSAATTLKLPAFSWLISLPLLASSSVSWRMCTYYTGANHSCSRPPSAAAELKR